MQFERLIEDVKEQGVTIPIEDSYWNLSCERGFFILLDDIDFRKDFSNVEELKQFRIDGRKFEDIISEFDEEDLIF